jgi:hypothetical protein
MSVFWRERTLNSGSWAHGLSWLLAPKRLITGWHPKIRPEARLGGRYVQFEPVTWSGPFFFAGRPAVKAMSQSSPEDEAIVVGFLIERGYGLSPSHPNPSHDVMDRTWHWRGFERCLTEPSLRNQLNDLMNQFAPLERVIWIVTEGPHPLVNEAIPYSGMSTLDRVKGTLDATTSDQWVSVMCGVRLQREHCLRFSEAEILREFSSVLVQAAKIAKVVESAIPSQ